jgi:hypothetical protein
MFPATLLRPACCRLGRSLGLPGLPPHFQSSRWSDRKRVRALTSSPAERKLSCPRDFLFFDLIFVIELDGVVLTTLNH